MIDFKDLERIDAMIKATHETKSIHRLGLFVKRVNDMECKLEQLKTAIFNRQEELEQMSVLDYDKLPELDLEDIK